MKIIKLMIIVLVAVLGFSSCSKESDSNKEKKLVKIYCEKKSNDKKYLYSNWTFEYNEEEQLVSAYNEIFSGEEDYIIGTYKYTWYKEAIDVVSDIKIKMSFVEDEEVTQNQKYTLILKDGRFSYGLGLGEEESTKSIYSYTKQISEGFITIKGGNRVGITGSVVMEKDNVINMNYISSLNFRIARQIKDVSDSILKYVINIENDSIYNTIIASPPGTGKTTILRDFVRKISNRNT